MTNTFQGKPCKQGHGGRRYVSNGHCVFCISERGKRYYQEKIAKKSEQKRAFRAEAVEVETPAIAC